MLHTYTYITGRGEKVNRSVPEPLSREIARVRLPVISSARGSHRESRRTDSKKEKEQEKKEEEERIEKRSRDEHSTRPYTRGTRSIPLAGRI